jgi:hypothetical protein
MPLSSKIWFGLDQIEKILLKYCSGHRHLVPGFFFRKKSLKIPKGQSESVYRRRTDNTMANRNSTKGQTTINKTYI